MLYAVGIRVFDLELQDSIVLRSLIDHLAIVIHIGYPEREEIGCALLQFQFIIRCRLGFPSHALIVIAVKHRQFCSFVRCDVCHLPPKNMRVGRDAEQTIP